ncbi:MAG TPA: EF-P lysine aminoacylase EpmA [Gammaproteobacteria bacterium]|nr:EF-P lysine aminoacylase EpmA [Gammaproteobacteria bacterium]
MSTDWQPAASFATLNARAKLLQTIREFMLQRDIMEVETPVLGNAGVNDPAIRSLVTRFSHPVDSRPHTLYLQTSPEYAMKRLLAAGSGPVYQIGRVFRDGELGRLHNPEFTLLEWYRPGFDHHALMEELDELMILLGWEVAGRYEYRELFLEHVGIDAVTATLPALQQEAGAAGLHSASPERSVLLDFLFSHRVVPQLGLERPAFVMHYPACQGALARLKPDAPAVAERFELFVNGIEIANGFHELTDAGEQRQRINDEIERRRRNNDNLLPIDERLLAALEAGLPDCAGVAVGVDRLLMCLLQLDSLQQVLAFPVERA